MDEALIKKLKDDPYFKEFLGEVVLQINKLNSIEDLQKMSNEQAGEAVKVRVLTTTILQGILSPFLNFKEKKEPTVLEVQRAKKRAGLA